ncbi:hypothetical protein ACE193_21425 [Bernardetia sp. OM2101]|uniref:hypothetical protein n=1 Tax=Bernardetia sp. OM2101 TaxID=3344876 RepID=UPI0035CFD1D8
MKLNYIRIEKDKVFPLIILLLSLIAFLYIVYDTTETHIQEVTVVEKNINKWYPNGKAVCGYLFNGGSGEWHLVTDNPKKDYNYLEVGKTYLVVTNNRLGIKEILKEK